MTIISEYVEGSGWNKAIELFNDGLDTINLSDDSYELRIYHNGGTLPRKIPLLGSISPGGVYVISHTSAGAQIKNRAVNKHMATYHSTVTTPSY